MILRPSLGLGDAVYMFPVVKYYMARGEDVHIVTRYPSIFKFLNCKTIDPETFDATQPFIDCNCSARTKQRKTNIYEDTLLLSGINGHLPLTFEYSGKPYSFNTSKKVCVIRNLTVPTGGVVK